MDTRQRDLLDDIQNDQEKILEDLEILVNIDSPADYAPGLAQVKDIIVASLASLGAHVEIFPTAVGGYNIAGSLTGSGQGHILLLAHADTVFEPGTAANRPFRVAGGKAYGPGVSDNKAGVVMGIYAMKLLQQSGFYDFAKITLLINSDEETGSLYSRDVIIQLAKRHDYVLVLEGGRMGNGIAVARKGSGVLTIEVKGKASHAGSRPEQGVNAIAELVNQLGRINQLADSEKGTTINVTFCRAGDKVNVIPDYAIAKADVRIEQPDEFDRIEQAAWEMAKHKQLAETDVLITLERSRPAFPRNPQTDALAARVALINTEIGLTSQVFSSGGVSDGNLTADCGTPTIDSMGFIGGHSHTPLEYLDIGTIPTRLYVLIRLLQELGSGGKNNT